MKKLITIALLLTLLLGLAAACGDSATNKGGSPTNTGETPGAAGDSPGTAGDKGTVTKDNIKIGVVHIMELGDQGYTFNHDQGAREMIKNLGLRDDQYIPKFNVDDLDVAATNAAINELIEMRAEAAADEMVKQIAFVNQRGIGTEFQESVHPCFAGLKKMGGVGSRAALKGLREMELGGGNNDASYRAGLMALVIRAVEGDDVGQYILLRERATTKDEKRQRMYDQLINPTAKK